MDKVTVIIPVHNGSKYLEKCLDSVINQTYKDIEIIVVDDASSDNSSDIYRLFKFKDNRIKLLENRVCIGPGASRNKGLDAASGKYVVFIDNDDYIKSDMIEKLVTAVKDRNADVAVCGYETFEESSSDVPIKESIDIRGEFYESASEVAGFFSEYFPEGICGYLWNKIYLRSTIEKNNIRFKAYPRLEDGFFNIEFFSAANTCAVIDDCLYCYRKSSQEDTVRKVPVDYSKLVLKLALKFYDFQHARGLKNTVKIDEFFYSEIGSCVESAFFKREDKKLGVIRNSVKEYKKAQKNSGGKTGEASVNLYRKTVVLLLSARCYLLLRIVVYAKVFSKRYLKKLFFFLRKRF